jgi:thiamine-phosphate pyrophosphorylase
LELMKNIDWRLCLIVDAEKMGKKDIISAILEAVKGGVSLVQLRAKKLRTREFLEMSLKISEILKEKNIPFIINDRVDIALSCKADGVHLGQQDLSLFYARKIMGKNRLIGVSINTVNEATEAEQGGADYLGVGPVFFTPTKEDLRPTLGIEGLREIRKIVRIPILAIGGVNAENARKIIDTGVNGVAVVSAILSSENIKKAARELAQAVRRIKS